MQVREKEIIEYPSTLKLAGLSIGAAIFVAGGAGLFAWGQEEEDLELIVVGAAGIIFFGGCLLYLLSRLIRRKPSLVIDDEGIMDHSSYTGGGAIRWEQIRDITVYELMGQRFIGLELHDPGSFLEKQSPFKRVLLRMNRGLVEASVNIPQTGVRMPLDELYAVMTERWNAALRTKE
ncbi:STM3941 family protein [Paenibacillus sp. S-38]|uniref:STM3941 family protein n=1 Tax=Paenibacillus sp. S-38 TaxID=3416710 RepID=UPI003CEF6BDD